MKKKILALLASLCFICTGCGNAQIEESASDIALPYPGSVTFTREEQIANVKQMVENVKDSYSQMLKEAAEEAATKAGKKAVELASDQLQKQIDKFDNINWDSLSDEEIDKYSETITNTLSQIRELRDKIAGI